MSSRERAARCCRLGVRPVHLAKHGGEPFRSLVLCAGFDPLGSTLQGLLGGDCAHRPAWKRELAERCGLLLVGRYHPLQGDGADRRHLLHDPERRGRAVRQIGRGLAPSRADEGADDLPDRLAALEEPLGPHAVALIGHDHEPTLAVEVVEALGFDVDAEPSELVRQHRGRGLVGGQGFAIGLGEVEGLPPVLGVHEVTRLRDQVIDGLGGGGVAFELLPVLDLVLGRLRRRNQPGRKLRRRWPGPGRGLRRRRLSGCRLRRNGRRLRSHLRRRRFNRWGLRRCRSGLRGRAAAATYCRLRGGDAECRCERGAQRIEHAGACGRGAWLSGCKRDAFGGDPGAKGRSTCRPVKSMSDGSSSMTKPSGSSPYCGPAVMAGCSVVQDVHSRAAGAVL